MGPGEAGSSAGMTATAHAADDAGGRAMYRRLMAIRRIIERHWLDALIVVLVAGGIAESWLVEDIEGTPVLLTLFALCWGLPMLARRRFPIAAPSASIAAVAAGALIWSHAIGYTASLYLLVVVAVGTLGANLAGTRARLMAAAGVLAVVLIVVFSDPEGDWTDLLGTVPGFGIAFLVGYIYRSNSRRTAELRERAERLERERHAEARAAVAEERSRIAREMHDVVAHSLSVMVVQAEAAEEMLGVDPERARTPLVAVQDTGRTALGELRRMLGVLREQGGDGAALAPQPGLAGLDELVAQVRAAGLPVRLRVEGERRALPSGVDLSAYRIVQEGLTNTLKHAGPARAEVVVSYGHRHLDLRVSDDGRGHDPASNGDGHGLVGMRERVALYGGELRAGPAPGGGYLLTARLPLDPVSAP